MDRRNGFPGRIWAGLPEVPAPRGMALSRPKALKSFSVFPPGKSLSGTNSSSISLGLCIFAQQEPPATCESLCATEGSAASWAGFQGFRVLGMCWGLCRFWGGQAGSPCQHSLPVPAPSSPGPVVPAPPAAQKVLCLLSLLNISKARRGFVIFPLTPGKGGIPQDCDLDQSLEQES